MRVFLSHNAANKDFVRRVAMALRDHGLKPWLDVWQIRVGDALMDVLEKEITACECFVLFWSQESKTAPYVEWERQFAARLGGKRRICVRLDDIVPPPEQARHVWLDWLSWREEQTFEETLAKLLRAVRGKPQEDPPAPIRPIPGKRSARLQKPTAELFERMFALLHERYGEQNWWSRDNKFQLCVEAILTQGTGWKNVNAAISNLEKRATLTSQAIAELSESDLRELIRPCGRTAAKAEYIRGFAIYLGEHYGNSVERFLAEDTLTLRRKLRALKGMGQFTSDNILLYGADRPTLPINDRMRKVFFEHDLVDEVDTYDSVQQRFQNVLPFGADKIREMDAMIYRVAREHCSTPPNCDECPLAPLLSKTGPRSSRL
jgi:endonuclease-3 related protein